MKGRSVLGALDETWAKFKKFVEEDSNRAVLAVLPSDKRAGLDFILARDVLVIVADLQDFFSHEENVLAVKNKDEGFLAYMLPPEINVSKIPDASKAKFFLFARVALSLLADLEKE